MIKLTVKMRSGAPPYALWSIISDVQNMPKYWQLHRDVKVLERAGSYLRVLVNMALPRPFNKGEALVRVSNDELIVTFNFIRGPFRGKHIIKISGDSIVSAWYINPVIPLLMFKSWVIRRLNDLTVNALMRLINDALNLAINNGLGGKLNQ